MLQWQTAIVFEPASIPCGTRCRLTYTALFAVSRSNVLVARGAASRSEWNGWIAGKQIKEKASYQLNFFAGIARTAILTACIISGGILTIFKTIAFSHMNDMSGLLQSGSFSSF